MSIIPVIKEVGRGAAGARSLSRELARITMGQVLDGEVSEIELGALLIALRMKGETLDELTGFLDAVQARCAMLDSDSPVVLIPSYNGARRLCNFTPLLAMSLAQEGARVLVHGNLSDPVRTTSAAVFHDLGLPAAHHLDDVQQAWARHEPAFVGTALLCPALQTLLDRRWQLGVRNAGHTVAKMLNPVRGTRALRLVNFTHPEFGELMRAWAQRARADVLLLRGTEGEPAADPRRMPRVDTYIEGQWHASASAAAHDGVLAVMPLLPRSNDAASTALYVQSVIGGERPAPAPLARQVQLILNALSAMTGSSGDMGNDMGGSMGSKTGSPMDSSA